MEQTYIDIMIQSLEKKEQVLDRIIELDIKQKNQLEDPQLTPDDFDEVVEAKSRLIDQLNNLDSGFEKLFERTKEELNGHKEDYKEHAGAYPQYHGQERKNTESGGPQQGSHDSEICVHKEAGPRGACRHAGRKPLLQVHVRNRIYGAAVYGQ